MTARRGRHRARCSRVATRSRLIAGRADEGTEDEVDPLDHRLDRAEVGGERDRSTGVGPEPIASPEEGGDVGAAEPVDRLLGIADHEQVAGSDRNLVPSGGARLVALWIAGSDAHRELDLDRIGVLELVEEKSLIALVQPSPHGGAVERVAQHGAGQHQEVVELELAGGATLLGGPQGEAADGHAETVGTGAGHVVANLTQRFAGLGDLVSGGLDVGPAAGSSTVADLEARRFGRCLVAERFEQVEFVVDGAKVRGVVGDLVEMHQQSIVWIGAVITLGADRIERAERINEAGGNGRRFGRDDRDTIGDEVPVGLERCRESIERSWLHARGHQQQ